MEIEEEVHISQIQIGDTIKHYDTLYTVGKNDIKRSEFMGLTLRGDNYRGGTKKVIKITFKSFKAKL